MIVQVEIKNGEQFDRLQAFVKTLGENRDPSPVVVEEKPSPEATGDASVSGDAPSAAALGAAFKQLEGNDKAHASRAIGQYMSGLNTTHMSELSDGQRLHVAEIISKYSGIPF